MNHIQKVTCRPVNKPSRALACSGSARFIFPYSSSSSGLSLKPGLILARLLLVFDGINNENRVWSWLGYQNPNIFKWKPLPHIIDYKKVVAIQQDFSYSPSAPNGIMLYIKYIVFILSPVFGFPYSTLWNSCQINPINSCLRAQKKTRTNPLEGEEKLLHSWS